MKKSIQLLFILIILTVCVGCDPKEYTYHPFMDSLKVTNLSTDKSMSVSSNTIYINNNINISIEPDGTVLINSDDIPHNSLDVSNGDKLRIEYSNNDNKFDNAQFYFPGHTYKVTKNSLQAEFVVDMEPQICQLSCKWFDNKGKAQESKCKIFLFINQ